MSHWIPIIFEDLFWHSHFIGHTLPYSRNLCYVLAQPPGLHLVPRRKKKLHCRPPRRPTWISRVLLPLFLAGRRSWRLFPFSYQPTCQCSTLPTSTPKLQPSKAQGDNCFQGHICFQGIIFQKWSFYIVQAYRSTCGDRQENILEGWTWGTAVVVQQYIGLLETTFETTIKRTVKSTIKCDHCFRLSAGLAWTVSLWLHGWWR